MKKKVIYLDGRESLENAFTFFFDNSGKVWDTVFNRETNYYEFKEKNAPPEVLDQLKAFNEELDEKYPEYIEE